VYTVGMTRKEVKTYPDPDSASIYNIRTDLQVWGTNSSLTTKNVSLELTAFDLSDGNWKNVRTIDAQLLPNQSTELWAGAVPGQPIRNNIADVLKDIVISARLLDKDGNVLARSSNWPEPYKYIHFPSPKEVGLSVTVSSDGEAVTLDCLKPIKGIILDAEGEADVNWSNQAIDLVPGDPQSVKAVGLKGRKVTARFLGDGSA